MFSSDARWKVFDSIAADFDRFRPGYPTALIDTIIERGAMPHEAHILEIGCGSGHAAIPFAQLGYKMMCLEPGPRLAALARRHLAPYPHVRVEECTFENWPSPKSSIDLILAAQSFQYVDRSVCTSKAANILKPSGSLAIFGNQPTPGSSRADELIHQAYLDIAPHVEQGWQPKPLNAPDEFVSIDLEFPWTTTYSAADYVGLMKTRSPIILDVSDIERETLLSEMFRAVTLQGSIEVNYIAHLCFATRLAV